MKIQITNCKLRKRVQKKLLEFFVLQVTSRSAADILGIQPNSAILFYRKIRMVISHYLALVADENVVAVVACAEDVGCTGQNKVFNVVWKGIADVAVNRIISAIWVFNDCIVAAGYIINVISRRACCCLCKGRWL